MPGHTVRWRNEQPDSRVNPSGIGNTISLDPSSSRGALHRSRLSIALPRSIPGEPTVEINIGQRSFLIGSGPQAHARRQQFFQDFQREVLNTGVKLIEYLETDPYGLLEGEFNLIDYFGISPDAAGFMADFFQELPRCQSDTNVFLKNGCETVYKVLWMSKMSRHQEGKRILAADNGNLDTLGGDVTDMDLAGLQAWNKRSEHELMIAGLRDVFMP